MTKFNSSPDITETSSFGTHRQADRPASPLQAGASSMPAAWQTRGVASAPSQYNFNAQPRNFADMTLDPFRWAVSTPFHKGVSGVIVLVVVLVIIF